MNSLSAYTLPNECTGVDHIMALLENWNLDRDQLKALRKCMELAWMQGHTEAMRNYVDPVGVANGPA